MIKVNNNKVELYPYQNKIIELGGKFTNIISPDRSCITYSSLVNTTHFSYEASMFLKKGFYTDAPEGTKEYDDYWDEQEDRCLNGYQVGDLWITGRHYFYLNFFPMWKADKNTGKRILGFPSFWRLIMLGGLQNTSPRN